MTERDHTIRKALSGMLALLLTVAVLAQGDPASAAPIAAASTTALGTTATDEAGLFALLNRARAEAGLPPMSHDAPLADTSRSWSATMGSKNLLHHDPNLGAAITRVEPNWRSAAENVGMGYGVQQLHDAFMASAGHRANIMSPKFNRVGIGVIHVDTKIWVTVRFIEGPAIAATSVVAPVPTPPGVPTVLTGDFNADGFEDTLTYGPGSEADELWFGLADRTMWKVPVSVRGQYQPVAGDFDGDGRTEILWYAPGGAADFLWEWNGSGWSSVAKTINGRYTALAGDFDADGFDDVLWYAPGDSADYRWYGTRSGAFTSIPTTVAGSFIPVVGDFNGDGGDDVLWYGRGTATDVVWYSTGVRGAHRSARTSIGGSHTPFAGDFDGNGVDDIFLYTPGSPPDHQWFNTRTTFAASKLGRTVNGTYLAAAADFDGDRADDALWFSPSGASGDPLWWGVAATSSYVASTLRPR
jgi:hypothetical protein